MTRLIIARHGETDWDAQGRIQGSLDIPLNSSGKKQAQRLAEELSGFGIGSVYSGPSACCFTTANEVASRHNVKVKKMGELNELDYGVWQGLLLSDIKKRYRKQYGLWKKSPSAERPPRGECIREACDRAVSAIHKIADKHKDAVACVISHDTICSILKCYLKNVNLDKLWSVSFGEKLWEAFDI